MTSLQVHRGLLQSNEYLGLIYGIISNSYAVGGPAIVHTSNGADNNSYDTFKGRIGKYK